MKEINQQLKLTVLGGVLFLGMTGPALGGDVLTLPTQDGPEFYVVEGFDSSAGTNQFRKESSWVLTSEGTLVKRDSLENRLLGTKGFKAGSKLVLFPGLRTSLLGRVLGFGQYDDSLEMTIGMKDRNKQFGSPISRLSIPPMPNESMFSEDAKELQILAF